MSVEKFFKKDSSEKEIIKEIERRREILSTASRREAIINVGLQEENLHYLVKDMDYAKVTPVFVRELDGQDEPSLLVTLERGEEALVLGYISMYYNAFDSIEMDALAQMLYDKEDIVFDLESESFITI